MIYLAWNDVCHCLERICEDTETDFDYVYSRTADIPPADVRPVVRGKWKFKNTDALTSKAWTCSVCGLRKVFMTNFCPNCGADMREDKAMKEKKPPMGKELNKTAAEAAELGMSYGAYVNQTEGEGVTVRVPKGLVSQKERRRQKQEQAAEAADREELGFYTLDEIYLEAMAAAAAALDRTIERLRELRDALMEGKENSPG